jgi:hypothetical protein
MIALLANPPAPLALRVDLLAFRRPNRTPSFSELIWQLHQIIVNPASIPEEVKVAKRDMLRVIGKAKQSPNMLGSAVVSRFRPESTQKIATRVVQHNKARPAQVSNHRKVT